MNQPAQLAVLALALVLAGTLDFMQRIHVGRDAGSRTREVPSARPLPPPLDAGRVSAEMLRWIPGGAAVAEGAASASDRPRSWTLRGVFTRQGVTFAVLEPSGVGASAAEPLRVIIGDRVDGWTVTAIESHSVSLQGDDGTLQLFLFKIDESEPPPNGG